MGTKVLRPQNWLSDRIRAAPSSFTRRKTCRRPEEKRPNLPKPSSIASARVSIPKRSRSISGFPTMGPVTILRRGESQESLLNRMAMKAYAGEEMARSGFPAPDIYAGSAFSLSPAPSALPLPSFYRKNPAKSAVSIAIDDMATRDLRRLLRLE